MFLIPTYIVFWGLFNLCFIFYLKKVKNFFFLNLSQNIFLSFFIRLFNSLWVHIQGNYSLQCVDILEKETYGMLYPSITQVLKNIIMWVALSASTWYTKVSVILMFRIIGNRHGNIWWLWTKIKIKSPFFSSKT